MNRTAAAVVLLALTSCSANDLSQCVQTAAGELSVLSAGDATCLLATNHKVTKRGKDVPKMKASTPQEVTDDAVAMKKSAATAATLHSELKSDDKSAAEDKSNLQKLNKARKNYRDKLNKDSKKLYGNEVGKRIIKVLDDGLKLVLKAANDLKKQSDTYSKDIQDKVSQAQRQDTLPFPGEAKAAELQKVVEETVDAFLKLWQGILDLLNSTVANTTNLLVTNGQPFKATMIGNALSPVIAANDPLVLQLKKVKKSLSGNLTKDGFDSTTSDETFWKAYRGKLTEAEGHLKKVNVAAEAFTKILHKGFDKCLKVIGTAVKPVEVPRKLSRTEKHFAKDFSDSFEKLAKGIKTGIEITKMGPTAEQKSKGHRSSTVVALAMTAVAAIFFGF